MSQVTQSKKAASAALEKAVELESKASRARQVVEHESSTM
jgi:hypothetical protein